MHLRLALAVSVSALAFASTSFAQSRGTSTQPADTSIPGAIQLDTITVEGQSGPIRTDGYVATSQRTGTKTDTPLIETPQSVSTVTRRQLEDRNPQSLNDALEYTPGLLVNGYGFDPRFDAFFVRGFPVTYTGIFRDGLRQLNSPTGLFKTEPYGLEGITVLKGPAATLYGASSAGGLVDLITKRPTASPFREVEVQLGSHGRKQTNFDLSGPVDPEGKLLYRLTGLVRESGTQQIAVPDDKYYVAPAFTWAPTAATKLTVLGEVSSSLVGGTAVNYNDANGITPYFAGDPNFNDFRQQQQRIGYEFEHRFDQVFTLRQNFRYAHVANDLEYTYFLGRNGNVFNRGTGRNAENVHTAVIDTQLQADFATGPLIHRLLAGVDGGYVTYKNRAGFGAAPDLDAILPNYGALPIAKPVLSFGGKQEQLLIGAYLQDQIKWGGWTLTLGGRRDWVSGETTSAALVESEQKDTAWSGRVGLSYLTAFGLAPYVSYSSSFAPNVGTTPTGAAFVPTTAEQIEAGVKYKLPDVNAFVTAAVFDIQQRNGVFFEVQNGINVEVQRGKLRSRGVELEATGSLENGLSFTAAYAYTDLEIVDGAAGTVGNTLSATPYHTASLWADYKVQGGPLSGLGVGAGVRYLGPSFGNDTNTVRNEAKTRIDAAIHYDLENLNAGLKGMRVQVNARNLLDEAGTSCAANYCYLDEGRTVIASLRHRW
jgi:iron complex outermembrane receptor protein